MKNSPSVLAVVVQFRAGPSDLLPLIEYLSRSYSHWDLTIAIVENGTLGSFVLPSQFDKRVEVLRPGINLGYGGALELARRAFPAEYIWVFQEDIMPMPNCGDNLLAAFDQYEGKSPVGIVSPIEEPRASTGIRRDRLHRVDLQNKVQLGKSENISYETPIYREWQNLSHIEFVYLSGAMIRSRTLNRIGGFDATLWPLMWVDLDVCVRTQLEGYAIGHSPQAVITHSRGRYSSDIKQWKKVALEAHFEKVSEKYSPKAGQFNDIPITAIPHELIRDVAEGMSAFIERFSEEAPGRPPAQNTGSKKSTSKARNPIGWLRRTFRWSGRQ